MSAEVKLWLQLLRLHGVSWIPLSQTKVCLLGRDLGYTPFIYEGSANVLNNTNQSRHQVICLTSSLWLKQPTMLIPISESLNVHLKRIQVFPEKKQYICTIDGITVLRHNNQYDLKYSVSECFKSFIRVSSATLTLNSMWAIWKSIKKAVHFLLRNEFPESHQSYLPTLSVNDIPIATYPFISIRMRGKLLAVYLVNNYGSGEISFPNRSVES